MDRAKRQLGSDPDAGIAYWKAMVEGRWTLVERFESDGRHLLVARANEPHATASRALSPIQRKIVGLVATGRPSKLVAYELGITESTVSRQLAEALRKLGVRTRAELVALHASLNTAASRGRRKPAR
ncbi:hypothetical protein AKJ09_02799 [Labilithrix luteola]|uniref:HTH luxR-type domain-containing protein n=2 Tax=Labilithrix luteola TaxID=1391654 RepID=A0A0K1PRG4_9BACT|nr:hypothetical protein AKJ09_02799 [Labilithrix luteola]